MAIRRFSKFKREEGRKGGVEERRGRKERGRGDSRGEGATGQGEEKMEQQAYFHSLLKNVGKHNSATVPAANRI